MRTQTQTQTQILQYVADNTLDDIEIPALPQNYPAISTTANRGESRGKTLARIADHIQNPYRTSRTPTPEAYAHSVITLRIYVGPSQTEQIASARIAAIINLQTPYEPDLTYNPIRYQKGHNAIAVPAPPRTSITSATLRAAGYDQAAKEFAGIMNTILASVRTSNTTQIREHSPLTQSTNHFITYLVTLPAQDMLTLLALTNTIPQHRRPIAVTLLDPALQMFPHQFTPTSPPNTPNPLLQEATIDMTDPREQAYTNPYDPEMEKQIHQRVYERAQTHQELSESHQFYLTSHAVYALRPQTTPSIALMTASYQTWRHITRALQNRHVKHYALDQPIKTYGPALTELAHTLTEATG